MGTTSLASSKYKVGSEIGLSRVAMKTVDLLSAYLEMEFGSAERACARLKALVNDALDHGEWHEDFDIAVKNGELDHYECAEIWDVVRRNYPESSQRLERNVASVRSHFGFDPRWDMRFKWLVADDESVIVTEGLHVARFVDGSLVWVTKRISLDGIHITEIANGEVLGECDWDDWYPLRLAFADGALLEGKEIEF